ncbi:ADP-ribosylation_factor 1 [Hexamita inflata]|uniref:ADP-ribosylation_factor 1 n=1 Tax=Hexamita inflata TaxID=28002 RepID=A0ABP1HCB7_9EUKA
MEKQNIDIQKLFKKKSICILLLGLDVAGKTTILYKLGLGESLIVDPDKFGINIEKASCGNVTFISFNNTYNEQFNNINKIQQGLQTQKQIHRKQSLLCLFRQVDILNVNWQYHCVPKK